MCAMTYNFYSNHEESGGGARTTIFILVKENTCVIQSQTMSLFGLLIARALAASPRLPGYDKIDLRENTTKPLRRLVCHITCEMLDDQCDRGNQSC